MTLLDLGNELLLAIAENLELERDINTFVRANRRLYNLLNAYVYRHNVQKFGSSGLLWAANCGQEAAAQKFLKEEANVHATNEFCRTPLLLAAKEGHEAVVKLLLEKQGVELNSKDNNSQTPLSLAAERGYGAVVRLLLAKDGVDPDPKDNSGHTPLSFATFGGHKAVVELLLAKEGVDPNF